jgi:hypothetical protein
VTPPTIICFDAESNGLHGPAFAVGAVVLDGAGAELETFYARSPIVGDVDPWVRDNVLPVLADAPITHSTPREMRDAFWAWLAQRKATGMVVVDCGWPVEAGLLCACVADDPSRAFCGPYPLHEVASLMVAAGLDPMDDYSGIRAPARGRGAAPAAPPHRRCAGIGALRSLRHAGSRPSLCRRRTHRGDSVGRSGGGAG